MNNVKQTFTITIPSKTGYMDLTEDVMECVRRANIRKRYHINFFNAHHCVGVHRNK